MSSRTLKIRRQNKDYAKERRIVKNVLALWHSEDLPSPAKIDRVVAEKLRTTRGHVRHIRQQFLPWVSL